MQTKKIIALFVSATLFISCSSLSATSNQTSDLILGKWDCLTTMQIPDEELAVTMTFKHKDIFTKTDWLSDAEGVILASTATEQESLHIREFATKSSYRAKNQLIHSTLQELNPTLSSTSEPKTELGFLLNTVLSLTNLSLLQDIEKQTIDTYEVTEITSTALKIKSADKELQPTEQTQTTCTRLK